MHMCEISLNYSNFLICLEYYCSWQKQSMASPDDNLIDFSGGENQHNETTSTDATSMTPQVTLNLPITTNSDISAPAAPMNTSHVPISATLKPPGKANKSLFEITRVESHGESVGGDDSELDDTLSETHDSSSTSVLDSIIKHNEAEVLKSEKTDISSTHKPLSVNVESTQNITTSTQSSSSSTPVINSQSQHSEAPSRFRIVKISKSKPYDKGKWFVNDFSDSQRQNEPGENPASPMVRRTRHITESGGEQKVDRSKTVTSPTEPAKTKSSEFLIHQSMQTQSRGSSYSTTVTDRRSSVESTSIGEQSTTNATVTVGTLENSLGQIQSITESMVSAVNDEVRKLKDNLTVLQTENNHLKDENEKLKKRLAAAEERLIALDKG